ncbi:MAG: hypothetical protein KAW41_04310 [Candidatus Diapherotrites archaeon]|nr:hypothetical protein [Candidatus Diapherotrites archaeon]
MMKKHFLGAASAISISAGMCAVGLLSTIGFSIANLMSPSFYYGLLGLNAVLLLLGLGLLGVSMGALFSATRFLGSIRAAGLAALVSLIVVLFGAVFFWTQMTTYTVIGLAYVIGTTVAGFMSSKAKGSKFGIGFEHAKKAMIAIAIVSFVGVLVVVAVEPEPYRDQFVTGVTGVAMLGVDDLDEGQIRQLIIEKSGPKMEWGEFISQVAPDYASYRLEDQQEVEALYASYSADYEAALDAEVQVTLTRISESEETAGTLIRSLSFFEFIFKNIELSYAGAILALFLVTGTLAVAPAAGGTSLVFHKPLPEEAKPRPKEKAKPLWDEEKGKAKQKKLKELEERAMRREKRRQRRQKK